MTAADHETTGPAGSSGYDRAAGARLREAREHQGLSVAAIAKRLRLETRMVEALERGDEANLPEPTFVRGYLRSYARLVDVPEHEVLGHSPAPTEQAEAVPPRTYTAPEPALEGWARWTGYGLAALLAVLVVVWWQSDEAPEPADGPATAERTAPAEGASGGAESGVPATADRGGDGAASPGELESQLDLDAADATPWLATSETADNDASERGSASSDRDDSLDAGEIPLAGDRAASLETAPPAARGRDATEEEAQAARGESAPSDGEASPDAASGPLVELALEFDGESWVEIEDARGERLMFDLGRGGGRRRLAGEPPFEVLLGNAPAVTMRLEGEPVDVGSHTRGNDTARFTLNLPGED